MRKSQSKADLYAAIRRDHRGGLTTGQDPGVSACQAQTLPTPAHRRGSSPCPRGSAGRGTAATSAHRGSHQVNDPATGKERVQHKRHPDHADRCQNR